MVHLNMIVHEILGYPWLQKPPESQYSDMLFFNDLSNLQICGKQLSQLQPLVQRCFSLRLEVIKLQMKVIETHNQTCLFTPRILRRVYQSRSPSGETWVMWPCDSWGLEVFEAHQAKLGHGSKISPLGIFRCVAGVILSFHPDDDDDDPKWLYGWLVFSTH